MNTYFLFGEIHGTKECANEFFKFIKEEKIKKVALEISKDAQHEVDEFIAEKRSIEDITFFKNKEHIHDGRVSESLKQLLNKIKAENIKIFLVEEEAKSPNKRDELMAKNLSKIKGKVAFLCGTIHAMKQPLQLKKSNELYAWYPQGKVKTCGYLLSKNHKVISIRVHAINGGTFYNFAIQEYEKDILLSKKYKASELPQMIKSPDDAFDYLYVIDTFSYAK